uniref:Uncharacterized protein n=1 Tax=Physcomitrium patens TaxID=3218 RepID=A0A7I4ECU8_PHYPA
MPCPPSLPLHYGGKVEHWIGIGLLWSTSLKLHLEKLWLHRWWRIWSLALLAPCVLLVGATCS